MYSKELQRVLRVNNHPAFNREVLKINSIIGTFGLTLHYIPSEDKWYLGAVSSDPPSDLSRYSLTILGFIYELRIKKVAADFENLLTETTLPEKLLKKYIKELQQNQYITIQNNGIIEFTKKTKRKIIIRGL